MNRRILFVGHQLKPFHLASIYHAMRELRIGGGTVLVRHPFLILLLFLATTRWSEFSQ